MQLGIWGREFDVRACNSCKAAVEAGYPNVAAFIPVPASIGLRVSIPRSQPEKTAEGASSRRRHVVTCSGGLE